MSSSQGWFLGVTFKFMPYLLQLCPLLWIHISAVHLNSIDHKGTRRQTYNELRSKGIGCKSGFSLLTTIAKETMKWNSQVTVSRDSGARREAEGEREKQREIGVYKQTPCNKFVFSRCQVPWPSLRLSVRSILFGLACALAVAINFTECYEPLIRLANEACNLAEAKPTALWIADTLLQRLKETATALTRLWLKLLCVCVYDYLILWLRIRARVCMCMCVCNSVWHCVDLAMHVGMECMCEWVRVCVCFIADLKASWQLLIFHQKQDWGFRLAHPSFLFLSQTGWKWNGLFYGEWGAQNGYTIERGGALKQLGGAVIYFHLHKITGLFDHRANSHHSLNETWPWGERFHQASHKCCGLYRERKNKGRIKVQ